MKKNTFKIENCVVFNYIVQTVDKKIEIGFLRPVYK